MDRTATSAFFKKVDEMAVPRRATGSVYMENDQPVHEYDRDAASQWVTMARTALESVLPRGHAIVRQFEAAAPEGGDVTEEHGFETLRGIFRAARRMLDDGYLSSILDGIRAETEIELLGQAENLLAAGYKVAAAVLAGGALETHLSGLCAKNGLAVAGAGSISKYDGAIAQERNSGGMVIYTAADSKSVIAWGGTRNGAAHDPTTFALSVEGVRLMIGGIRDFIARST